MKNILTKTALITGIAISALTAAAFGGQKEDLLEYAKYTANFEGRRTQVYDPNPNDGKPEPTIGVGHYLDRGDSRETFARVLPEVNYEDVYSGKQPLTNRQVNKLFAADLPTYVNKASKLFPKFDSYSLDLRKALVDGCYRGDFKSTHKTTKLINQGKFTNAAIEYTNRKDFREAPKKKMMGIVTRMQKNRLKMFNEGRKRK